jgi:hypothetical protein
MSYITFDKKIVKVESVGKDTPPPEPQKIAHKDVQRPVVLNGATYKIKTPLSEHALYITINNIEINGKLYPREMFINSKNMEHFQWIIAITRIVSALFRDIENVAFLVEELRSVYDPRGGYFKKGGRYMPSLVAEIGDILETHLQSIGIMEKAEAKPKKGLAEIDNAILCTKCNTKAMVRADGCETCLSCGYSKCG